MLSSGYSELVTNETRKTSFLHYALGANNNASEQLTRLTPSIFALETDPYHSGKLKVHDKNKLQY
jgi:hypothetical protein